jgi:phospholipase D1/2
VLRNWMGPRLTRIRERIVRQGVLAIAAIRMVPIAPFTLVNMVAGASGIRLFDYVAGTMLGLLPGLIVMSALGTQIARIIAAPSAIELALFVLCIVAWIGLTFGIQLVIRRFSSETP